jgi:hypothetical protein
VKRLVASLFAALLVVAFVIPTPAEAGCAPWCTPRCHAFCKEVICYKVTGTFNTDSVGDGEVRTFTITDITDDQGNKVTALMGMTFEVSADSDLSNALTEVYKAHFTYQPSGSQIILHQPPAAETE